MSWSAPALPCKDQCRSELFRCEVTAAPMSIVYFTLVAIILYLAADWMLERVEVAVGKRLEHRSLVFFAILLVLALSSFTLIRNYTGG